MRPQIPQLQMSWAKQARYGVSYNPPKTKVRWRSNGRHLLHGTNWSTCNVLPWLLHQERNVNRAKPKNLHQLKLTQRSAPPTPRHRYLFWSFLDCAQQCKIIQDGRRGVCFSEMLFRLPDTSLGSLGLICRHKEVSGKKNNQFTNLLF